MYAVLNLRVFSFLASSCSIINSSAIFTKVLFAVMRKRNLLQRSNKYLSSLPLSSNSFSSNCAINFRSVSFFKEFKTAASLFHPSDLFLKASISMHISHNLSTSIPSFIAFLAFFLYHLNFFITVQHKIFNELFQRYVSNFDHHKFFVFLRHSIQNIIGQS